MGSPIMALFTVSTVMLIAGSFSNAAAQTPLWNDLKLTFNVYDTLPRTLQDAINPPTYDTCDVSTWVGQAAATINGYRVPPTWTSVSGSDCTNGGQFNGYRYIPDNDSSMNLLFDSQGTVAGIQMNIPKSQVLIPTNDYQFDSVPFFQSNTIQGVDMYSLTAYFVDPSTICSTGRDNSDLTTDGTGNALYLQSGPTPSDLVAVPSQRSQAEPQSWTNNTCFPGMGYHNFYDVPHMDDVNCQTTRPYFLLFNNQGVLTGFGFQVYGFIQNHHYENPDKTAIKIILGTTPNCVQTKADTIKMTTMHVFLTSVCKVVDVLCPITSMG